MVRLFISWEGALITCFAIAAWVSKCFYVLRVRRAGTYRYMQGMHFVQCACVWICICWVLVMRVCAYAAPKEVALRVVW